MKTRIAGTLASILVSTAVVGGAEQARFEKWDIWGVEEIVCPREQVLRGIGFFAAPGPHVMYLLVGFHPSPPGLPSPRQSFSTDLTNEDSERILRALGMILRDSLLPESLVPYGKKTHQDICAGGFKRKDENATASQCISFRVLMPHHNVDTTPLFIRGFIGNTEPIASYDDVFRIAGNYMKPSFLGPRDKYSAWVHTTDTKVIDDLARTRFGGLVMSEDDLAARDVPRTFQLDNGKDDIYLRGGRITIREAGVRKEIYGFGFKALAKGAGVSRKDD